MAASPSRIPRPSPPSSPVRSRTGPGGAGPPVPILDTSVTDHFRQLFRASDSLPEFLLSLLRQYPLFPLVVMLNKEGNEIPATSRNVQHLADQALEIVQIMENHGIEKGDRVILVFFPSVDFVIALWACYLGGFVAVPVPPPIRLTADLLSFSGVAERSGAKFVLSHNLYFNYSSLKAVSHKVSTFLSPSSWWGKPDKPENEKEEEEDATINWPDLNWIYVDSACGRKESQVQYPTLLRKVTELVAKLSGDDLAHLQMTSGSTASPKLVQVQHKAIILNVLLVICDQNHPVQKQRMQEPNYDRESCPWAPPKPGIEVQTIEEYHRSVVLWIPHFHDFFMFHIPAALVYCCKLTLISPVDFLAKPLIWLKACHQHRAAETCAPNFALDLAVAKSTEQERQAMGITLHEWTTFVTQGGEPLCEKSFQRFCFAFPFIRMNYYINAFGMAEAVAGICAAPLVSKNSRTYIEKGMDFGEEVKILPANDPNARVCFSCGNTEMVLMGRRKEGEHTNSRVIVVREDTFEELPEGHIGEVWSCSPGFGSGYWGWTQEENDALFNAKPTKCITAEEGRTFLRSGDRGFILNGQLFLVGRIKSVLIFQGRNYEPSDIEYSVWGCHPNLRPGCTAALSVPNEDLGTDELVLISEVRKTDLSAEEFEKTAFQMREVLADGFSLVCPEILFFGPKKGVIKTTSGKPKRNAILEKYTKNSWTPLHVSKSKVVAMSASMGAPEEEVTFPDGAEEKIVKIFQQLRQGQEENNKLPEGANVLDETLSAFSVSSSEMVRIQNLVHDEFGVYIPSGVLLRIDPNAVTVRQLFACYVFTQNANQSPRTPQHSPLVYTVSSPEIVSSPAPRSRSPSPSKGYSRSPNNSPKQSTKKPRTSGSEIVRGRHSGGIGTYSSEARLSVTPSRSPSPHRAASPNRPTSPHRAASPNPHRGGSSPQMSFLVSTQSSAHIRATKKEEKKEEKKEKKEKRLKVKEDKKSGSGVGTPKKSKKKSMSNPPVPASPLPEAKDPAPEATKA